MRTGNDGLGKDVEPRPLLSWRHQAKCQYVDPEMFFPDHTKGVRAAVAAVAICKTCPVTKQCLDFAEANGIEHGVWGGQSGKERKRRVVKTCQRGHEITGDNAEPCVSRGRRYTRCRTCKKNKDRESFIRHRKCTHRPFEPGAPCRECAVEAGKLAAARRWGKAS